MKKLLISILCLVMTMSFALPAAALKTVPLKSIKLDKTSIKLEAGKTYNLKATLSPSNTTQKQLKYTTSNNNIALVDTKGKITAKKAGTAVISVISSVNKKIMAKCNVTVTARIPLKKVKLTWYVPGAKQADHDKVLAEFNKKLGSKIQADLDLRVLDWGSYVDKMNMLVAAQDDFDICFTASWFFIFHQNVSKGAFEELDNLINQYAPKLKSELPSSLIDVARVKGKLYAVPNFQSLAVQWGLDFQKPLVDKYSFDYTKVKSLKDIEQFLAKVKAGGEDVYPYYNNLGATYSGYEELGFLPALVKIDSTPFKAVNKYDLPETKAHYDLMRQWYLKGYIRKDIATIKDQAPDLGANKYAVVPSSMFPGSLETYINNQKMEYVEIPLTEMRITSTAGMETMNAISKTSKNPERAIKLLEIMSTDKEMYNLLCFGIEGIHYKKVSSNQIEPVKESKYAPGMNWAYGNTFNSYYTPGLKPGLWEETLNMIKTAKVSPIRGFVFNNTPVANETANVSAVEKEYSLLGSGVLDYEKVYPEFMDKLEKAGIDKIVAELQKQLDAWAKAAGKY